MYVLYMYFGLVFNLSLAVRLPGRKLEEGLAAMVVCVVFCGWLVWCGGGGGSFLLYVGLPVLDLLHFYSTCTYRYL